MNEILKSYVSKFIGSVEGMTADNLPRATPALSEIPEGLIFGSGKALYARVGGELLNLRTGIAVNASSVISKREGKFAVAKAVVMALQEA